MKRTVRLLNREKHCSQLYLYFNFFYKILEYNAHPFFLLGSRRLREPQPLRETHLGLTFIPRSHRFPSTRT
jgi:hypothetical protein